MSVPFGSDPWLDARLRNVPLPVEMLARLKQIPQQTPAENEQTASVGPQLYRPNAPVPIGATLTNEQMDAGLNDVALPPGMIERLERIALERRSRVRPRQLALAASVMLALGLAYVWRSAVFTLIPGGTIAQNVSPDSDKPDDATNLVAASSDRPEEQADDDRVTGDSTPDQMLNQLAEELRQRLIKEAELSIYLPDELSPAAPSEIADAAPAVAKPNRNTLFTKDGSFDNLPDLELVSATASPHGIAPPLTPGYDLRFQAKYGQHPFVNPSAHKDLQALRVPLVTSSASYHNAWRALAKGKLPPPDEVRVEEFLSAVDYGYPAAAPGTLALRTAAGPAPFAEPGMKLLQVGVQAGALVPQSRPGTALTVVVDTSASMRWGGRLTMVRRALADVAAQLDAHDQMTLIAFSDEASVLVEAAGPDKLNRILAAVQSMQTEEATNVGAGLELACSTALSQAVEPGQPRRVMLLTDGLSDCGEEATERIETMLKNAAEQGATLSIVNVGGAQGKAEVAALERFAQAGGGSVTTATEADGLRFTLLETLSGRNQVVAREASLRITFNPQAVAGYRLLGHETETLTGSTAAPSAVDLRAGEAAGALVELRLRPEGGDDVATIDLTWRDAASGELRSATQRVSRVQFAKSFAESPLALQTAALVGRTAEVLRGSYFAADSRAPSVLDLAGQASPLAIDRPTVRAFLSFVAQAEKMRIRGGKRL